MTFSLTNFKLLKFRGICSNSTRILPLIFLNIFLLKFLQKSHYFTLLSLKMSYKPRDNQKIARNNQPDLIRKTILRNPEVPLGSQILSKSTNDLPRQQFTWHKELSQSIQKPTTSRMYHEPRLNKLTEMRKSLNEIKSYEAKTLEGVHDLTKNSQRLVNREVRCLQI